MAAEQKESVVAKTNLLLQKLMQKTESYMSKVYGEKESVKKTKRGGRMTEKEEDEILLKEADDGTNEVGVISVQPANIMGKMRDYQLEGMSFFLRLQNRGLSGILADEMGLGKTLQSISVLAYLKHYKKSNGPHLVVVPLTTLGNWVREFTNWCPTMKILRFHGNKEERKKLIEEELVSGEWEVCITSYEMCTREKAALHKFKWEFIIVDEAHRLKNENSLLSKELRKLSSKHRLLLTGTPLQNNLHELWALLNYLLPQIFSSSEEFDAMFTVSEEETSLHNSVIEQLHKILRPVMLRRLKSDVETALLPKKETLVFVGMSELQNKVYHSVLSRNLDAVNGQSKEKTRLLNIVMQLRKAANHPYLFEGIEDRSLPALGEHLITNSGKVVVLDKLLNRLKSQGSRVLIFSQMTRTIDILEDYCNYRGYIYCRIDGTTSTQRRDEQMKEFNDPDSKTFLFLLSTRAGGLGINLATADIVILYDSDWNPQMDLQAQDRAHRIGQKKQVFVYRFVTENTIEEKIIEKAEMKLRLDAMVIQQGRLSNKKALSKDDFLEMIRYGAERVFRTKDSSITDEDIDIILSKGEERTAAFAKKLGEKAGLLSQFSLSGEEIKEDRADIITGDDIIAETGKRKRGSHAYVAPGKCLLQKLTKIPKMPEYQFFDIPRIEQLQKKELRFYTQHQFDPNPPALKGLTDEEEEELKGLLENNPLACWNRNEYRHYLRACQKHGRGASVDKLAAEIPTKTVDQVKQYHAVFWEKCQAIPNIEKELKLITKGEKALKKTAELEKVLEESLVAYPTKRDIMEKFPLKYRSIHKGRGFTSREDRFLLAETQRVGYGEWDRLRESVLADDEVYFDYYLKSRTATDLGRRVDTLLRLLQSDMDVSTTSQKRKENPAQPPTPKNRRQ